MSNDQELLRRFENCFCTVTRVGRVAFPINDLYLFDALAGCGDYCFGEMKTYQSLITPGMSVLDIGANIGLMSLLFSKLVGEDGKVFSFEPSSFSYRLLCHNLDVNDCLNVGTFRQAVSDEVGTVPFADPDASKLERLNFGALTLQHRIRSGLGRNVPTEVVTVDALGLEACDFIKIDVEGAEAAVVRGARATLDRFRPFLSIETGDPDLDHSWMPTLIQLGYRVFVASFVLNSWPNFKGASVDHLPYVVCANAIAVPAKYDADSILARLPCREVKYEAEILELCRGFSRHLK